MDINKTIKTIFITLCILTFVFTNADLRAQHRGDNLSFQGVLYKDNMSAKAGAMAGALTAVSGDVLSLFYNTAGLSRIEELQVSVGAYNYSRQWRENQNWYPDRQFTTLPFYLEGLYIPKRENSGRWDYELYKDTAGYLINEPKLGKDPYDEDVAQWKNTKSESGFKNIAVALPFNLFERKFVAAAGYYRNSITDFDRNETYLSPTLTSYDYENFKKVVNGVDTLNVHWNRFLRQRYGSMDNIVVGLSNEVFENIMVGVGVKKQSGNSDDYQSLVRFGDLHLIDAQKFKFYFVDTSTILNGTSKYSSTSFNIGAMFQFSKIKIGIKVDLPYTLTREYNYTETRQGAQTTTRALSGKDKVDMPAVYNFGLSFQPVESFLISFNYENAPYSKATFNIASGDTAFRNWYDQNTLSFGAEYKMYKFLTLMAGYRSIPEVFVPDGAAIKDRGPLADSYNFGISVNTIVGRFDLAYEYRRLKYYDSYFSNANYVFESNSVFMFGFSYSL